MTRTINNNDIRKILVIKLRAVGDVLLSTVVLKNLRNTFPNAHIDFLTEFYCHEVLLGNPFIDDVVLFTREPFSGVSLIFEVRKRQYDLVLDLFCNPRTALITYLSGAKYRVGYPYRGRKYAYNIPVILQNPDVHNIEFNLEALRALGIEILERKPLFYLRDEDEQFVGDFLFRRKLNGELLIALNPSGGWYTKRWRLDRFAELGDVLAEKFQVKILLLWGPGEQEDVEKIQWMMHLPAIIPPATTLKQLGALLKACSLVVSNDSAPMHIAAALGTPVVGIYGPTNPKHQGPVGEQHGYVQKAGLDCLGCNLTKCPIGHLCMGTLEVLEVMRVIEQVMERNKILKFA